MTRCWHVARARQFLRDSCCLLMTCGRYLAILPERRAACLCPIAPPADILRYSVWQLYSACGVAATFFASCGVLGRTMASVCYAVLASLSRRAEQGRLCLVEESSRGGGSSPAVVAPASSREVSCWACPAAPSVPVGTTSTRVRC